LILCDIAQGEHPSTLDVMTQRIAPISIKDGGIGFAIPPCGLLLNLFRPARFQIFRGNRNRHTNFSGSSAVPVAQFCLSSLRDHPKRLKHRYRCLPLKSRYLANDVLNEEVSSIHPTADISASGRFENWTTSNFLREFMKCEPFDGTRHQTKRMLVVKLVERV
jgi:hypothetical protein